MTFNEETGKFDAPIELSEGGSPFGFRAKTCNSNFFVYYNTANGKKYLIQSMPTERVNSIGYGSNTTITTRTTRADLYIKAADLTSIINGISTTIEWTEGINISKGQGTGGYSSICLQSDGSIGIVIEEYPVVYCPEPDADCDTQSTDNLLATWYMSLSFENLTQNSIAVMESTRSLTEPTISPESNAFTIDNNGKFAESTSTLPYIQITADEIVVAKGETWHIEYTISVENHIGTEGVTTLSGITNGEDKANVSFDLRTYLTEQTLTAGDVVKVSARTVATDADGNELEASNYVSQYYTVVNPGRKAVIKVMPHGPEYNAFIMASRLVNANEEIFVNIGYELLLNAEIPEGVFAEFKGFSLNGTEYIESEDLKNNTVFSPTAYEDPTELTIVVPTSEAYAGDTANDDCITLYAWFEPQGGLWQHSYLYTAKVSHQKRLGLRTTALKNQIRQST